MQFLSEATLSALAKASKATAENPVPATRVNIIFHGLLAFRDLDTNYYEVLIPRTDQPIPKPYQYPDQYKDKDKICPHEAKYGNPCLGPLQKFPEVPGPCGPGPAQFSFEGITPIATGGRSFPSATNTLIMKNSLLTPQYENVRTVIRVPKPLFIRHYRGGETHGAQLGADANTIAILQRNPDVLHEITVFSYRSFFRPRLVGRGSADDCNKEVYYEIRQHNPRLSSLNIGIYSQPNEMCQDGDSEHFNAMFKINTGSPLNIDLSAKSGNGTERIDDGPPLWTSPNVGISIYELLALSELNNPWYDVLRFFCCGKVPDTVREESLVTVLNQLLDATLLSAIPGGCGSGFSCDDGL